MAGLNTKTGQRGVQAKSYQPKQYGGSGNYGKDAQWQEGRSPATSTDQQFSNMGRMDQMANRQRTSEMSAMKQAAGQASQQNFNYNRAQQSADIGNKLFMDGTDFSRQQKAASRDASNQRSMMQQQAGNQMGQDLINNDSRERMNRENNATQLMGSMMNAASGAGGGGGWRWW